MMISQEHSPKYKLRNTRAVCTLWCTWPLEEWI